MPTELSKVASRSSWNRQPTGLEPTCKGGETMPIKERGQPHLLCWNFVLMSSYAHEPKGFGPSIVWREFTLMLEFMHTRASTHVRMNIYLTICTIKSAYIRAQHTEDDNDNAPTTVTIQFLRCITSLFSQPSTLSGRRCNSSPVSGFRALACSAYIQIHNAYICASTYGLW